MKKLAILLLATVMLFTCFALAACGDGEESSTPSTSKTASDNKSDAPSNSSTSSEATTSSKDETTSDETTSEPETTSDETTSEPETTSDETTSDDTSSGGDVNAEPSPFWITHYDDATAEGAGMILTEDFSAGSWDGKWCDSYAFKPIEGVENGYELVELVYGTIANGDATYNGSGKVLAIPEGGFVYTTSIGNNYTSENIDTSKPDYVNDSCNAQISRCRTWKVGDKFTIEGLDLDGKTVPKSSDESIMWYEKGYVCTATITPIA